MKKQIQLLGGLMIFIAFLTINSTAFADFVIKGGATIKVMSGTTLTSTTDVLMESGGTIDNSGTVTFKGDFTNNGTANLGTGEFVLAGTLAQAVGGTSISEFETLTVNNSSDAGVTLTGSIRVDFALALTDGFLSLGTNIMTLSESSTYTGGSDGSMIITDNTGELRKEFLATTGSFIFPVGDNAGVGADYSPITITFTGGIFTNAYVGVMVKNDKHPNNNSYDNYLNRYWSVSQSGIAGYEYDVEAQYTADDVILGSGYVEADIRKAHRVGTEWFVFGPVDDANHRIALNTLTEFGDFTGVEFQYLAGLKVFLQGAYDDVTDLMRTDINPILPLSASTAYSHLAYSGPENATVIPSDAVDWVLVELRDAEYDYEATSTTVLETVAGFLMKDGSIVSVDGVSSLPFTKSNAFDPFFVIIHRNHLSAMTKLAVTKTNSTYVYDMTTAGQAYGTNAMIEIGTSPSVFALYGGDSNSSSVITYSDKQPIDDNYNDTGYLKGDTNLSGTTNFADKQHIDDNINTVVQLPY